MTISLTVVVKVFSNTLTVLLQKCIPYIKPYKSMDNLSKDQGPDVQNLTMLFANVTLNIYFEIW